MDEEQKPLSSKVHFCTYECQKEISLCNTCEAATWTLHGKCGRCKAPKKEDISGPTEIS